MKLPLLILLCALLGGCCISEKSLSKSQPEFTAKVEVFEQSWVPGGRRDTRYFTYEETKGDSAYSLRNRSTGELICEDVYYLKTFGGVAPTVEIHVVNGRYLIYPQTIRHSEIPGAMLNDMMAILLIYDLKKRELLTRTEPFQYNSDVPLRYNLRWLISEE